jgi:hypothetical protein
MKPNYPNIGICGLSCRLCPSYYIDGPSRCGGCKSESRMTAGCQFITCAVKKKGIEFCWECDENSSCERWAGHRQQGQEKDSFVCYASLEANISSIIKDGLESFVETQSAREEFLCEMLANYNEGRSKSYYCIAATMLDTIDLEAVLENARGKTCGMDKREKSKNMHSLLDAVARKHSIKLALRK